MEAEIGSGTGCTAGLHERSRGGGFSYVNLNPSTIMESPAVEAAAEDEVEEATVLGEEEEKQEEVKEETTDTQVEEPVEEVVPEETETPAVEEPEESATEQTKTEETANEAGEQTGDKEDLSNFDAQNEGEETNKVEEVPEEVTIDEPNLDEIPNEAIGSEDIPAEDVNEDSSGVMEIGGVDESDLVNDSGMDGPAVAAMSEASYDNIFKNKTSLSDIQGNVTIENNNGKKKIKASAALKYITDEDVHGWVIKGDVGVGGGYFLFLAIDDVKPEWKSFYYDIAGGNEEFDFKKAGTGDFKAFDGWDREPGDPVDCTSYGFDGAYKVSSTDSRLGLKWVDENDKEHIDVYDLDVSFGAQTGRANLVEAATGDTGLKKAGSGSESAVNGNDLQTLSEFPSAGANERKLEGNLKYMTDFTGYSNNSTEQSGWYMALKKSSAGNTYGKVAVGLYPNLDSGSNKNTAKILTTETDVAVLRVADKDKQVLRVVGYTNEEA